MFSDGQVRYDDGRGRKAVKSGQRKRILVALLVELIDWA
jgi:hypothetical protein